MHNQGLHLGFTQKGLFEILQQSMPSDIHNWRSHVVLTAT